MKRLIVFLGALAACTGAFAQDDAQKAAAEAAEALVNAPQEEAPAVKPVYWTKSSVFDLGLNQTSLSNWAAGGFNNATLTAAIDAKADYAKDLASWNNRLQLQYGFLWSQDKEKVLQKSNDRIYLESKFAYKTGPESKWNWTAGYDFRSQFTDTYSALAEDGTWDKTSLKSGFFSPAYNNIALGIEWKPVDWFDINFAPLTGSLTFCNNALLRKGYGMPLIEGTDTYRNVLFQFGASIKTNARFAINDVFNYETQLVLFTDYLNRPFLQNRVNWDNKVTWQLAKYFKVGFSTWLIYDPIVEIDGVVSKVQFKDFLSFNLTYTLGGKQ